MLLDTNKGAVYMKKYGLAVMLFLMGSPLMAQVISVTNVLAPACAAPGSTIPVTFTVTDNGDFVSIQYDVYFSTSPTLATGAWSSYLSSIGEAAVISCPAGTPGGYSFQNQGNPVNTLVQDVVVPATGYSGYIIVAAIEQSANVLCTSPNASTVFVYPCVLTNTPSFTPTITPTFTVTSTPSVTSTFTFTNTPVHTYTETSTSTNTATATSTLTSTSTSTNTRTSTSTSTQTPTVTVTNSATSTVTSTLTHTCTATATATSSATSTSTNTATKTATNTATSTSTNTATNTNTRTVTNTATSTSTSTATNTVTVTFTPSFTPTPYAATYFSNGGNVTPTTTPTYLPLIAAGGAGNYTLITGGVISTDSGPSTATLVGLVSNGSYIWGPNLVYTNILLLANGFNGYNGISNNATNAPVSIVTFGPGHVTSSLGFTYTNIRP